MSKGNCSRCKIPLSPENARLSVVHSGCGYCRDCKIEYARNYAKKNNSRRLSQLRKMRKSRVEKGICIACSSRPPVIGKQSCFDCLLRRRLSSLPAHTRINAKKALFNFNGKCDCCGNLDPGRAGKSNPEWCMDHNHTTGNFRGILCHNCNTALGYVKDSIDRLNFLSAYLKRTTDATFSA